MPTVTAPVVRSVPIADPGPLWALLPGRDGVGWLRGGEGMVGWGIAARLDVGSGPDRFERAERWWENYLADTVVDDAVGHLGTGPVAFGSFSFDARSAGSVLLVPRVIVGRRDGTAWLTTVDGETGADPDPDPIRPLPPVRFADQSAQLDRWRDGVAAVVEAIRAGTVDKVVLALDLPGRAADPVDPRALLDRLVAGYPGCWAYAVDGLVGATPELLVARRGERVRSAPVAGTMPRAAGDAPDTGVAALLGSAKEAHEHALVVESVVERLAPYCTELTAPPAPTMLRLPTVVHLTSEVTGRLANPVSALRLAGALHPTAAVAGTPTDRALAVIRATESMDRGRYAGPVGWVDARGDGEWGIALRCAEITGSDVRLFAGCGIVAGSEPETEAAEWNAKISAVRALLDERTCATM